MNPCHAGFAERVKQFNATALKLGLGDVNDYFWYHAIDLPHGLTTPGKHDFRGMWREFGFPEDMRGLRVLDIGPATGFFSFEFAKRGAEVVALELPDLESLDRFPGQTPQDSLRKLEQMLIAETSPLGSGAPATPRELYTRMLLNPFDFCQRLLKLNVRRCFATVYDIPKLSLGTFDLVFMGDILLHTINPLEALAAAAGVCRKQLVIAQLMPDFAPDTSALAYVGGGRPDYDENQWWRPNAQCLCEILKKLNFDPKVQGRHEVAMYPSGYTITNTVVNALRSPGTLPRITAETVSEMPFTGERYVPLQDGDIRLEHMHRYAVAAELARGKNVLDIACGEGYGSALLAETALSVTGVDISAQAIEHASAKYKKPNLAFKTGACLNIPLADASADLVVCFETLEHISEHEKFMLEIRRVLAPGGLLLISTPNKPEYAAAGKNPFHKKELEPDEFAALLRKDFKNVRMCGQRVAYGSYITPQEDSCGQLKVFRGRAANVSAEDTLPAPMYLLALAANAVLPNLPASLFDGTELSLDKDSLLLQRGLRIEELSAWGKSLEQDLRKTENALRQEQDRLRQTQDKHLAINEELAKRLADREQSLRAMTGSLSWRITVPCRLAGRAARKALGLPCPDASGVARPYMTLKPRLIAAAKKIYRRLPLSPQAKYRLKKLVFRTTGSAPSGVPKYTLKQDAKNLRTPDLTKPLIFKECENPLASIVIPVHGHCEYTVNCLRSIIENTGGIDYEVIVVDDASPDNTHTLLATAKNLRVLANEKNKGFLLSANCGAAAARGKYLVLLNNDTIVQRGWLAEMLRTFNEVPQAGLVGAKLLYPDGMLQEAGGIMWRDASGWNYGNADDAGKPEYNYRREADWCSGACIALPKTLWHELHGFDERYVPAFCEDSDMAFAVRKAGRKVIYQPMAAVTHYGGVSCGTDLTAGVKKYQTPNTEKFAKKWARELAAHRPNGEKPELERERNVASRILIIDACTLTPDQDAGSLTVLNHMRVFQNLGYKVSFIPDNLCYAERYTADLQRMGVECHYQPYIGSIEKHLKLHGPLYNAVMLCRPYVAEPHIEAVRRYCPDAKIIFDTEDLHFLRERRQAVIENNPALAAVAEDTRLQELGVAARADCTVVVSEDEKNVLLGENPRLNVAVIRPPRELAPQTAPFAEREGILFIGGFRHTPNVDAVFYFMREIWPAIKREMPGVKFHIIGSNPPEEIKALTGIDVIVHGYVADIAPHFARCRLSVAPIRFGAGVKCKLLSSLCHGLPAVASASACEGTGLENGQHVLTAAAPDEFAKAAVRLYNDEALWRRLAAGGLGFVERYYSLQAAQAKFAAILGDAL